MNRFEVQFVDRNRAALIQRVTSVMPIADELINKGMINEGKYDEIRAEKTNQEKMRVLFEALRAGGDRVKIDFYYALKNHEKFLFKDLGGVTTENEYELENNDLNRTENMQLQ